MKKFLKCFGGALLYLSIAFCFLAIPLTAWFNSNFGISFTEIIYTLTSPLQGANIDAFLGPIVYIIVTLLVCTAIVICISVAGVYFQRIDIRLKIGGDDNRDKKGLNLKKILTASATIALCIFVVYSALYVDKTLQVAQYFKSRNHLTSIYEEYYIAPDSVSITLKDGMPRPKNLIYIYLESMETVYATGENYIPHLTDLADENVSFSDKHELGGFHSTSGTGWTIAAILASQSGVAFAFPAGTENSMSDRAAFAPGLTTLGDILKDKGYYQEFICGSDVRFAGRDKFFEHGDFLIYDYFNAVEDGYAEASDRDFWGVDDSVLYRIAKDRLLNMCKSDQPFNLTMLTLDTHFPNGYLCELCGDDYDEQYANVIACADNQIWDFINWCKAQDFYENTVIVITGDHPFMGTSIVGEVDDNDRTVYNCFINAETKPDSQYTDRVFTTMDIFPTTLSAIGYEIEGDRLGLGANLFSDVETLAEQKGLDYMNQASGSSKYYLSNFN